MLFFLHGEDTYRSRQKLKQLKDKFLKEVDPSGLNLVILDGLKLTPAEFREAVSVSSFLAKKRMVVVENLVFKAKSKKTHEGIIEYLNSKEFPKDTIVVFIEDSKPPRGKLGENLLYQKLRNIKYAQEFKLLTGAQLNKWIAAEVTQGGGKIEKQALEALAAGLGHDLWAVAQEIDKLIAFVGKRKIEEKDLEESAKLKLDDNIFHFTDALANKKKSLALKLIKDQLFQGANALYLLKMITRQYRILIMTADLLERKMTSRQIATRLSLHPYVIEKSLSQVRKYSLKELKEIYKKLLEIDYKIKTSQATPEVLFDLFISEVC